MVVKMNEFEARGDVEVELRNLYSRFEHEGEPVMGNQVAGLTIVIGPYHLTLLESEDELCINAVVSGMAQTIADTPLYEQGWMIHSTEEVSSTFVKLNACFRSTSST
jgi:hypothetical protein